MQGSSSEKILPSLSKLVRIGSAAAFEMNCSLSISEEDEGVNQKGQRRVCRILLLIV